MNAGECPVCGNAVEFEERYPRRVCDKCADSLTDESGRRLSLEFKWSGGFSIISAETGAGRTEHVVYIDGCRCVVEEDRFGRGIVIQAEAG